MLGTTSSSSMRLLSAYTRSLSVPEILLYFCFTVLAIATLHKQTTTIASYQGYRLSLRRENESINTRIRETVKANLTAIRRHADESQNSVRESELSKIVDKFDYVRKARSSDILAKEVDFTRICYAPLLMTDEPCWATYPGCKLGIQTEKTTSKSGKACRTWSEVNSTIFAVLRDQRCRNPDGREAPWCFTDGDSWEYCYNICRNNL